MTSTAHPVSRTPLLPEDGEQVGTVAKFFRALGDPTRLRLLEFLLDGEHSVSDCVAHVGLAQGRVSTHLACLADCGYVQARREGRWCYYRATDPRVAERSLLAWARALGRLHTTMAGREADFDALMRRLGANSWTDPVADDIRRSLSELPELLEQSMGLSTPDAMADRLEGAAQLLGPTKYRSFSPSDVCPDNSLVTGNGVRFLDFEWGCVRDIALDAAYLQFPFPSSWCSYAMPENLAESMLATWRSEIVEVWPDLDDDEVLRPRLLDAQMLWVWVSTWWYLPRSGQTDMPIDAHMPSPRRSTALADRWQRLRADAEAAGIDEVGEYADRMVNALVERFGSGALELRPYPAFR